MPDDPGGPRRFLQANNQPAALVIPDLQRIATRDCDLRPVGVEGQMLSAGVEFPLPLEFPRRKRPDRDGSVRATDGEQPAVERKSERPDANVTVTQLPVHGVRNAPCDRPDAQDLIW